MRNREELNSYIQKKANDKIKANNRNKNIIFKLTCVLLLVFAASSFSALLYHQYFLSILNEEKNNSLNYGPNDFIYEISKESIPPSCNSSDGGKVSEDKEEVYPESFPDYPESDTTDGDDKTFLIIKELNSKVKSINLSLNILSQDFSKPLDPSDSIIYDDIISVKLNTDNIEKTLSKEQVELLYTCIKKITLKKDDIYYPFFQESLTNPEIIINITCQSKVYNVIINKNNIQITDYHFIFNREAIDVFLESIKNSVVYSTTEFLCLNIRKTSFSRRHD